MSAECRATGGALLALPPCALLVGLRSLALWLSVLPVGCLLARWGLRAASRTLPCRTPAQCSLGGGLRGGGFVARWRSAYCAPARCSLGARWVLVGCSLGARWVLVGRASVRADARNLTAGGHKGRAALIFFLAIADALLPALLEFYSIRIFLLSMQVSQCAYYKLQ